MTYDLPCACSRCSCKMLLRRCLLRSCSQLLRSTLIRRTFYATSSSASSAAPPVQQQFPEPDKERILELADMFEATKKPSAGFVIAMERFRKWVEENNQPASRSTVEFLLPICLRTGKKSDIDIVIDFINRRGWNSDEEGLRNSFLVSMAKSGQYDKALKIYEAIGDSSEKLRWTGIFAMMEAATNERDFPTLLSLSRQLRDKARRMVIHPSLHADIALGLEQVLLACKGVEDPIAMETIFELLDVVRVIRRKFGEKLADVMKAWVSRYVHVHVHVGGAAI